MIAIKLHEAKVSTAHLCCLADHRGCETVRSGAKQCEAAAEGLEPKEACEATKRVHSSDIFDIFDSLEGRNPCGQENLAGEDLQKGIFCGMNVVWTGQPSLDKRIL